MDPEAWRELADALNERPCPFAQAILSGSAQCAGAERLCIGERQALQCRLDQDQARCRGLFQALRQQARFALRSVDPSAALHHHQSLRLQIGGLRGLGAALDAGHIEPQVIQDIRALVAEALARFGSFAALPYPLILRAIARYQPRRALRSD